jgi:hypothetical protein
MNAATERMIEVLRARDWKFTVEEESDFIRTSCHGDNGQWWIRAGGLRDVAVVILSYFPVKCPAAKRTACAELFTRINFGLPDICFEMDFTDGEIICKTGPELPAVELLSKLFGLNLSVMDDFLPVIMQVIYAGLSPAKALANLEKALAARQARARRPKRSDQSRFQMN